jgi:flagellar hook-length control protein FliK
MILLPPALDTAIPLPTSPPSNRPEPTGVGRIGRPDRGAPRASFSDELRTAETVQRESAPAETEPSESKAERTDSQSGATAPAENTCDHRAEGGPQPVDTLIAALLQACTAAADKPIDAPAVLPAGADAVEEEQGQAASELLALLQEIQKVQGALGSGAEGTSGIPKLLEELNALTAGDGQAALPGKIHQMLRDLREHLSGIAWGRAVKEIATAAGPLATESLPAETAATAAPPADVVAADSIAGEEMPPDGARAAIQTQADKGAAFWKSAAERRAAAAEPASGSGRAEAPQAESTERPAFAAAAPVRAAGQRQEMPAPPDAWPQGGQETGQAPETGPAPAAGSPRIDLKAASAEEVAPVDAPDPASSVEQTPMDARLARAHDGRLERALEAGAAAGKDKETAGASRTGIFDQIVQRAVLQVKNEQSEIKIDLKPDFLGNVRMQIVTENQQVSVRILTEAPAVRDMIETGLQQLRSELQNQGLRVDRLEVSVSEDYREPRHRQGKAGERGEHARIGAVDETDRTGASDRTEPAYFRQRPSARRSTVDMFV